MTALTLKTPALVIAASLFVFSCSVRPAPSKSDSGESAVSARRFVNTVWRVSESTSVAPGTLYVFLSEGTLIITSVNSKPMLGSWKYETGALTMIEDGIPYQVDVLSFRENEFRIRSNNPGNPVEITFVPADLQSPMK